MQLLGMIADGWSDVEWSGVEWSGVRVASLESGCKEIRLRDEHIPIYVRTLVV